MTATKMEGNYEWAIEACDNLEHLVGLVMCARKIIPLNPSQIPLTRTLCEETDTPVHCTCAWGTRCARAWKLTRAASDGNVHNLKSYILGPFTTVVSKSGKMEKAQCHMKCVPIPTSTWATKPALFVHCGKVQRGLEPRKHTGHINLQNVKPSPNFQREV